ncbi:hypothetical protein [Planococcus salinarum]|uniref:hypothetical protein n=1 Tax=Planococcus salinarum TaxID=622695 RepID=UPI000E3E134A|nr:hypothetical protein [Planococcus salinarum]TAA72908.1 hypothetical protein D2909_03705 [Planococcus salinarum]
MYNTLPTSVKSNITRSVTKVFERYMAGIEWKEELYNIDEFLKIWRKYITQDSKWYKELSDEVKTSNEFHEELAQKMNQIITKILHEPPTNEQKERIMVLQKSKDVNIDYSCKAEAAFVESKLKQLN